MPRPGVSLLEVLRLVEEHLAASDAADQMADDYLARAAVLRKTATSHRSTALDLIHELTRGVERTTTPPPRRAGRPRLEESTSDRDREKAALVMGDLLQHPEMTVNAIAERHGVHHTVVERLAESLKEVRGNVRGNPLKS